MDAVPAIQYHHRMPRGIATQDRESRRAEPLVEAPIGHRQGAAEQAVQRLELNVAVAGVLALVAASILGTYFAFAFILAAFMLVALRPVDSARALIRFLPLLLVPLLALASTAWSDAPERTSRAALELLITVVAAVVVANRLSGRALILTLFCAILSLCVIALAYVPASLSSGAPLAGPFGSKNPMGLTAQLLVALSIVVIADKGQPGMARLVAIPSFFLAVFLIFMSNSGNAAAGAALMLVALPAFLLFGRCSFPVRIAISLFVLLLMVVALVFLTDIMAVIADFRQNVLKKDATLTGRTYLWDVAFQLAAERPWLGHGYSAFWRQGNVEAEALWRWGGITSRGGFNFHNAFVEMLVELGWVGSGLLVATCAGIVLAAIYALLFRPTPAMAFFLTFILVLYVRSYTENGLVAPFSLVTFIWIATGVYAVTERPATSPSQSAGGRRSDRGSGRNRLPAMKPRIV